MKKAARILSVLLVFSMLLIVLSSCGKRLSGTYSATIVGTGVEYKFSGSKVKITVKALGTVLGESEGKYSIKDDKITFEFEDKDDEDVKEYNGTCTYEHNCRGDKKYRESDGACVYPNEYVLRVRRNG